MSFKTASHRFTTEKPGWSPYFRENSGFAGMTLDEILTAADYTFEAQKVPTFYRVASGDLVQSSAYSVIRTDTGAELGRGFAGKTTESGVVTEDKGFTVIQLKDALHRVLDPVLDMVKDAYFVNLLGFDNGGKVAISLRLPGELTVNGESLTKYLNFTTGFDGQNPLTVSWNLIRPVCYNTFNMTIAEAIDKARFGQGAVKIRHTSNMKERLSESKTREILGLADKSYQAIASAFNDMAQMKVESEEVKQFAKILLPPSGWKVKDGALTENMNRVNQRTKIMDLAVNGEGQDPDNVTRWNLFNAVTQFVDWNRRGEDDETVKSDASQSRTAEAHPLKEKAFEVLNWPTAKWIDAIQKIDADTPKMTVA
jgi:hypothetical protein